MIISFVKLPEEAKKILKGYEVVDGNITDEILQKAKVILAFPRTINETIIKKAKNLEAIQTITAGADGLPYSILPRNIKVFSNAGAFNHSVSEHAWALILGVAKMVGRKKAHRTYLLHKKILLILGAGEIGSEIARIGKQAFFMHVIGVSRTFKYPQYFDEKYNPNELSEVISRGDVIVNALPLNKYTERILNYEILRKVKENCIIVNIGRGDTMDEDGIYKLLKERPDVRFATDVFWIKEGREDFDSKLWELDNFMGTLHIAGAGGGEEVMNYAIIEAVKNIRQYLETGKARNPVKFEDYL
ncbi:MAG TPA: NAD(P)-dependent oxidoreductase [Geobacterales bacterium]|nr:NAD(P)-dependent oxidoreductase [Geobacterales bacterium]